MTVGSYNFRGEPWARLQDDKNTKHKDCSVSKDAFDTKASRQQGKGARGQGGKGKVSTPMASTGFPQWKHERLLIAVLMYCTE